MCSRRLSLERLTFHVVESFAKLLSRRVHFSLRKCLEYYLFQEKKLPKGERTNATGVSAEAAYEDRVRLMGVNKTSKSLHEVALKLVEENRAEMQRLAGTKDKDFSETLNVLRTKYYAERYPNTQEGRKGYMDRMDGLIQDAWHGLTKPIPINNSSRSAPLFFKSSVPKLPCEVIGIYNSSFLGTAQYTQGSVGTYAHAAKVGFKAITRSSY